MSSQSIFLTPLRRHVPRLLPLESNAYKKGPPPESLCVQNTSFWHFETATPLLSSISGDEIWAMTSGFSNGDAASSTGAPSEPPNDIIEHELNIETARQVEMTKKAFLVIVFNNILPGLAYKNARTRADVQNFHEQFIVVDLGLPR